MERHVSEPALKNKISCWCIGPLRLSDPRVFELKSCCDVVYEAAPRTEVSVDVVVEPVERKPLPLGQSNVGPSGDITLQVRVLDRSAVRTLNRWHGQVDVILPDAAIKPRTVPNNWQSGLG